MDSADLSLRDLISASQYDDYYFINLYFYLFDLQTGPANTQESECVNQTSFNRVVLDRCRFGLLSHYQVCTDSFEPIRATG